MWPGMARAVSSARWPVDTSKGGGVHPFHMESITAGSDCAVLRIDGDIDVYAAPQIRDRVTGLAGTGTVHVIADLRGAGFLDSAGLGALVGSRAELRARGGSLTVVASGGRILRAAPRRSGCDRRRPAVAGGRLQRRPQHRGLVPHARIAVMPSRPAWGTHRLTRPAMQVIRQRSCLPAPDPRYPAR